jgi:hypothetical protein
MLRVNQEAKIILNLYAFNNIASKIQSKMIG